MWQYVLVMAIILALIVVHLTAFSGVLSRMLYPLIPVLYYSALV